MQRVFVVEILNRTGVRHQAKTFVIQIGRAEVAAVRDGNRDHGALSLMLGDPTTNDGRPADRFCACVDRKRQRGGGYGYHVLTGGDLTSSWTDSSKASDWCGTPLGWNQVSPGPATKVSSPIEILSFPEMRWQVVS